MVGKTYFKNMSELAAIYGYNVKVGVSEII